MALDDATARRLDLYAEKAREEFQAHWQDWNARDVAVWWAKWRVQGKTNHDRLGRILWGGYRRRLRLSRLERLLNPPRPHEKTLRRSFVPGSDARVSRAGKKYIGRQPSLTVS